MEELTAIAQAQAGDQTAFAEIVKAHQSQALRIAVMHVRNWHDAEEVAQRAFVKAWKHIRSFKKESSFSTWLYRIIVNQCHDHLRAQKVRRFFSLNDSAPQSELTHEERIEGTERTDAPVQVKELDAAIATALRSLPERQHSAFVLHYYEDMKIREIATVLKLSEGAVKTHLFHARQHLQKLLRPFIEEGGHHGS